MATNNKNFKARYGVDANLDITTSQALVSNYSSGNEGGEIRLATAATNTTLNTSVTIDIYQNKLRIFETGGTNRGAYIDLTAASTSVGSNLLGGGGTSFSDSAGLASALSDETGYSSGAKAVFSISPTISGTANINAISITSGTNSTSTTSGALTIDGGIGLNGNIYAGGNVVITGDLTVSGTTTTLDVANLTIEDNIVLLNSGVTGSPTLNAGIEVERGTATNASILWDETNDRWILYGYPDNDPHVIALQEGWQTTTGIQIKSDSGSSGSVLLQSRLSQFSVLDTEIDIRAGASNTWAFKNNGSIVFPDATTQTTAWVGMSGYTTDNLAEGTTNKYFTDARAVSALSTTLSGYVTTTTAASYLTAATGVTSVNSLNGAITATNLLDAIKTVDGSGSGLDADTLDGHDTAYFATSTHNHTGTYQPLDDDLTAIGALTGTSGFLKKTATNTWTLDTSTFLTSETDPLFVASPAYGITSTNITNWGTAYTERKQWDGGSTGLNASTARTSLGLVIGTNVQAWDDDLDAISGLASSGLVKRSSSPTSYSVITDNSSNWNTAYNERNQWDGGSTGLNASTARTSLSLVVGTNVQAWDADLDAIAALSGTSGYLKKTAANTWTLDTSTFLTAESDTLQTVTDRGATTTNAITITNTTQSTSKDTGSLILDGGLGVEKDVFIGGSLNVTGNVSISGTITGDLDKINVTDLVVTDPMIYMGDGNTGDTVDLGIVSSFNNGTYQHTGLVRDASDGKWKLFAGVVSEPTSTVDFTSATYSTLKIGVLEVTDATTTKTNLSLNNVENTALSTWAGSTNITTLGTIATGTWNATAIGTTKGGTNLTSYTSGDIIYASATNTLSKLAKGTDGQVLTLASGFPSWTTPGGKAYTINANAPTSPTPADGDKWLDTDTGIEYTYVTDTTSPISGQWVELAPGGYFGPPAAPKFRFSTSTTASDPGNGVFRYNNATISSVTAIYIDDLDADGNTRSNWFATWDDSTNTVKGHITIQGVDSTSSAVFQVNTYTANTGYSTIGVTYVSGGTVASNDTVHTMIFARTGDKGDTGATGATGATGPTATQTIVWNRAGTVSTGTGTQRFRFPAAATLVDISAAVDTAPTGAGSAITFNVLKNGSAIATGVTISAGANATASNVSNTTSMAAGDYLTINITAVGSTVAGSDLTVFVRYQ